jgi:demethylmenaquinone methyltransferase/2-methoxy-6-polyprenyl-1,4-benzoquinol methylase
VIAAGRRAADLGFEISSEEAVGRLLAVLAAAVPTAGRVLELGTGAGWGTAWLASGLAGRVDAELVSVERDHRLAEEVRSWPWPPWVRIVTGDGLEALAGLGTFDLIFADAPAGKFSGLPATLDALRPGGVLVLDDMAPGSPDEAQRRGQDYVRTTLSGRPDLAVVELEWSSGVILAARRPT